MGWRAVLGVFILAAVTVGCAGRMPTPAPTLPTPPPVGLRFQRDFPAGAEREHLALRTALGHEGQPDERSETFMQFADHVFNIGPGWCATLPQQTAENWSHMHWELTADGVSVPLADYPVTDRERVTGVCRL